MVIPALTAAPSVARVIEFAGYPQRCLAGRGQARSSAARPPLVSFLQTGWSSGPRCFFSSWPWNCSGVLGPAPPARIGVWKKLGCRSGACRSMCAMQRLWWPVRWARFRYRKTASFACLIRRWLLRLQIAGSSVPPMQRALACEEIW